MIELAKNANPKTWNLPVRWNGNRYSEASDVPAVPAPTSFTATPASSTVTLAWTNNATGNYQTLIERSPNGSTGWETVVYKAAGVTSHADLGLVDGTFYYRISTVFSDAASSYATANATVVVGATLLGQDTFESGSDEQSLTGRTFGSVTWTQSSNTRISTTRAYAGTKAIRLRFVGTDPLVDSIAEPRFDLGAVYAELTIKFKFYVPANYKHRVGTGNNNKFLRIWGADYGDYEKVGCSLWNKPSPSTDYERSDLWIEWATDIPDSRIGQKGATASDFIAPADYGTWLDVVMYIKMESAEGANDGIFRIYKNGTLVANSPNMNNYDADEVHGWRYGYLMGASNSGYDETTDFFIDNIQFWSGDAT